MFCEVCKFLHNEVLLRRGEQYLCGDSGRLAPNRGPNRSGKLGDISVAPDRLGGLLADAVPRPIAGIDGEFA